MAVDECEIAFERIQSYLEKRQTAHEHLRKVCPHRHNHPPTRPFFFSLSLNSFTGLRMNLISTLSSSPPITIPNVRNKPARC